METGKVVAIVTDPDAVTFSSPPSEDYEGEVRLASSVDVASIIFALAAIDQLSLWIHATTIFNPPSLSLVPSIDLCRRVVGCVCSWWEHTITDECPVVIDGFVP